MNMKFEFLNNFFLFILMWGALEHTDTNRWLGRPRLTTYIYFPIDLSALSLQNLAQRPRIDLNKSFLPRSNTTTEWKPMPHKSNTLPPEMFGAFGSVWCKMALGEVGVSLLWRCHALVLLAPGYWRYFLNLIIFS